MVALVEGVVNTRWLAALTISQILQAGQSLTAALEKTLESVASPQDRAFIQALCYGVCRTYHRLDYILAALLEKPIKAIEIKSLLLVGLYQIAYMRVKTHAAVSETVEAASNMAWAKALVNAVLRNYLRNKEELEKQADAYKPAGLSHPDWLIRQLEADWGEHAENIMQTNNLQPPMTLRINRRLTTLEHYLQLMGEKGMTGQALTCCPDAVILGKPVDTLAIPHFADGWVSVQDGSAQIAADLLDVQPGQRVLDVCAAPGGKTAHILERQPKLAELIAVDVDATRMKRVRDNLSRLNLQAKLIVGDAAQPQAWWDGKPFDRILLDAPCSATGVIRRHPDIKLLRRESDIATLAGLQKALLDAMWPLLASGGVLLYATCSVLKQENENQISSFLSAHQDALELVIPDNGWGIAAKFGRQILPGQAEMDGFYYARIIKH